MSFCFRRARRIGLGRGQARGGPYAQAVVQAIIGPGLHVAPVLLAADRLVQVEVQTPAAPVVQAQAPALAGCCTLGVGGFGQGQRLGATGRLGVRRAARAQQDSKAQGRYRQTAYAHFQPFGAARATQNILNRRVRREPVD